MATVTLISDDAASAEVLAVLTAKDMSPENYAIDPEFKKD